MLATADFFEYEDGGGYEMSGEVLVLQLCKFFQCLPEDLEGKDVQRMVRLMDLDKVIQVAQAARTAKDRMSPGEIKMHQVIEKMREADTKFHGPRESRDPDAPRAEEDD